MNGVDILLIIALAAVLVLAVRHAWKKRRTGGCTCGCGGCPSADLCGEKKEQ